MLGGFFILLLRLGFDCILLKLISISQRNGSVTLTAYKYKGDEQHRLPQAETILAKLSTIKSTKNSTNSMKVMMAKPNHRPSTPPESEMNCNN